MKKLINTSLLVLSLMFLTSCTNTKNAKRVLEISGYTNIEMTGYRFFGCSGDDEDFHDGFKAKAPNGEIVTGVVCSGVYKGSTIRLD